MWDPNQGRYVVGSCLLDVINTLRKGDYAEGSSGLLLNERAFLENSLERGWLCILES